MTATHADEHTNYFNLVEAWENSGQTQKRFCESRGVNYKTFTKWRGKYLARYKQTAASEAPRFVPVKVTKSPGEPQPPSVQITLPNGVKLSVTISFSEVLLLCQQLRQLA